ncbi:hypothetical protein AIOL_004629 [Candidatus Rhodobacter oscarellae]|uniref:Uncharacterized protein n=1 Tax=Candidatus Rhodobacter oscarellae TaxID=1675527 RepID=A0A0J9EA44_9RHOB|nr:hypothetical protein AIOL_004629 [Candidatus Rhodobacter lobularis]
MPSEPKRNRPFWPSAAVPRECYSAGIAAALLTRRAEKLNSGILP